MFSLNFLWKPLQTIILASTNKTVPTRLIYGLDTYGNLVCNTYTKIHFTDMYVYSIYTAYIWLLVVSLIKPSSILNQNVSIRSMHIQTQWNG